MEQRECYRERTWCFNLSPPVVIEGHASRDLSPCPLCVCVCQGKMLECGMLERDRQTLKRRSASLLKHLMVDEMLLMLLQAEDILTGNMAESIMVGRFIYCPVPSTSTSASVPCLLDSVTVSITRWSNIWLARWFDGRQQEFRNCVIKYKT